MDILIVLAPVFLVVALGAWLRRAEFLTADFVRVANRLTYWVALPAKLFEELAQAPHGAGNSDHLFAMLLGGTIVMIVVAYLLCRLLRLPAEARGTFVQSAFRGNLAYLGLPIAVALPDLFGAQGEGLRAGVILAIGPMMVIYNAVAVVALLASQHAVTAALPLRVLRESVRNPLLIACAVGAIWSWQGWHLPVPAARTFKLMGDLALPAALLCIGSALATTRLRGNLRIAVVAALLKTVACPLAGLVLARFLGIGPMETKVALILLATPCAAVGYTMVTQLGGDEALAASAIVISTVLSLFTFSLIIGLG